MSYRPEFQSELQPEPDPEYRFSYLDSHYIMLDMYCQAYLNKLLQDGKRDVDEEEDRESF